MRTMTNRERMRAFIEGRPHDRVPFVQYDNMFPNPEVWALLGRENVGILRWCGVNRIEHPHCRFETKPVHQDGLDGERRTLHTPRGSLTREYYFDPTYHTAATRAHYVKELADYDILDAYLADIEVMYAPEDYERALVELGDDGLPMVTCQRTAWQQLWVEWVGIGDLAWHMAEDEDRVLRTVGLLESIQRRIFDCIWQAKPIFVDFPDNITAPMIGREHFSRFCLPMYRELTGRLAEANIPVFCHMDGDLKPLWDLIGGSGLRGLDSFSPQPDNDTAVADAVRVWPHMRLAINFPSSVHLQPPDGVRQVTREILHAGGNTGRLQIQLSENVPYGVWRTTLPVIVEEILAFGTPAAFKYIIPSFDPSLINPQKNIVSFDID